MGTDILGEVDGVCFRGEEVFYVLEGGVVGKIRMSSSNNIKVLLEVVGVFEADGAFG